MPIIHERERVVISATNRLREAMHTIIFAGGAGELTTGEQVRVVTDVFAGWLQNFAKYAIREERHGDAGKPGGLG